MTNEKKYSRGSGVPHPVDVHAGSRLRARRRQCALSLNGLAETVDLTYQQLQKYETGNNRLSASRLYQFATVLDLPTSNFYFFEGYTTRLPPAQDPELAAVPLAWIRLYNELCPDDREAAAMLIQQLIKMRNRLAGRSK